MGGVSSASADPVEDPRDGAVDASERDCTANEEEGDATEAQEGCRRLEPGMRVRIQGMKAEQLRKLNGKAGILVEREDNKGSWEILLDTDERGKRPTLKKIVSKKLDVIDAGIAQATTKSWCALPVKPSAMVCDVDDKTPPPAILSDSTSSASTSTRTGSTFTSSSEEQAEQVARAKAEKEAKAKGTTELQKFYGPQSKRGRAPQFQLQVLEFNPHARGCFQSFARNEEELCGEWAVFYHSYHDAALLYEVHASIAEVLFRFPARYAPLPRIKIHSFASMPDATSLKERFDAEFAANKRDHDEEYREVAISTMCSLVSTGPEVSTPVVFVGGYEHSDDRVAFSQALANLLACLRSSAPQKDVKKLVQNILGVAEKYNLDARSFGGKNPEQTQTGHLLQIFIRRTELDRLVYASEPWGHVDAPREPISNWLASDSNTSWGQARIVAHPEAFCDTERVRLFVASASPAFGWKRGDFQKELTQLVSDWISADPGGRDFAIQALRNGRPEPKRRTSWVATPGLFRSNRSNSTAG